MVEFGHKPRYHHSNECPTIVQLALWNENTPESEPHPSVANLSQSHYSLPARECPYDRLIEKEPAALSLVELLALVLRVKDGTHLTSSEPVQRLIKLLGEGGGDLLLRLRHITVQELTQIHGIGPARASAIVAAIELGKRVFFPNPPIGTRIDDPAVAAATLSADLMWQTEERFVVLCLNVKHQIITHKVLTIGSSTETIAYARDVFGEAVRQRATRIIVAHNHPSGDLTPSREDIALTRQLLQAGQILQIPVLDHLILGHGSYVSIRQTTALWNELPQA